MENGHYLCVQQLIVHWDVLGALARYDDLSAQQNARPGHSFSGWLSRRGSLLGPIGSDWVRRMSNVPRRRKYSPFTVEVFRGYAKSAKRSDRSLDGQSPPNHLLSGSWENFEV